MFVNFGDDVIIWALFGTGIRTPIFRDWLVRFPSNLSCDNLTMTPASWLSYFSSTWMMTSLFGPCFVSLYLRLYGPMLFYILPNYLFYCPWTATIIHIDKNNDLVIKFKVSQTNFSKNFVINKFDVDNIKGYN